MLQRRPGPTNCIPTDYRKKSLFATNPRKNLTTIISIFLIVIFFNANENIDTHMIFKIQLKKKTIKYIPFNIVKGILSQSVKITAVTYIPQPVQP